MIKTRITKQPTTRFIHITCPACKTKLMRTVKINEQHGKDECFCCRAKFEWEEVKDNLKIQAERNG